MLGLYTSSTPPITALTPSNTGFNLDYTQVKLIYYIFPFYFYFYNFSYRANKIYKEGFIKKVEKFPLEDRRALPSHPPRFLLEVFELEIKPKSEGSP